MVVSFVHPRLCITSVLHLLVCVQLREQLKSIRGHTCSPMRLSICVLAFCLFISMSMHCFFSHDISCHLWSTYPADCFSTCLLICLCVCLYVSLWIQDTSQYVLNEMQALENEQRQIDSRADMVERTLRQLMESGEG